MEKQNNQAAEAVLMVRPKTFGFNEQTAWSNAFQERPEEEIKIKDLVDSEFQELARKLREKKIQLVILDDTESPTKPDAVFCNNWISFHHDGSIIFYPMMASNRRTERRGDVVEVIKKEGFRITRLIDFSKFEDTGKYLESTGSMVFDYRNSIIYACHSPRTDTEVLKVVADQLGMKYLTFNAVDRKGKKIYHTNVLMSIADDFAVICDEAIKDGNEREAILQKLLEGHEIIGISYDQLFAFAGNMLQLRTSEGNTIMAMSQTAFDSLTNEQINRISKHSEILIANIPTIEKYGGGSVRCMLADIHLPK